MGKFVKGELVVLTFPFSDLSATKRRPALVIAELTGDDVILCQITSKAKSDAYAIAISGIDFKKGGLPLDSCVRPNRIFTADSAIILRQSGALKDKKVQEVIVKLFEIINS